MHKLQLFSRCGSLAAAIVTVAAVFGASGSLAGASAAALPPGCSQSGQSVTCTYTAGSNPFTVPAGVSSIDAMAVGGMGGSFNGGGSHGAVVAGDIPTMPGETVYAVVGTNGGSAAGLTDGGDGGGASDVRTSQNELSSRLLVAAGGGGNGGVGATEFPASVVPSPGGTGGDGGGQDGASGPGLAPDGGRGGSSTAGGAGGAGESGCLTLEGLTVVCGAGTDGGAGGVGVGGAGGTGASFVLSATAPEEYLGGNGGDRGGGLFGGGGGGGGVFGGGGGGGGGGSNLVPPGGSASVDTTGVPEVVISYTIQPTSSSVGCTPSPVVAGRSATCTATVTDTATSGASTPTGMVSFSTGDQGSFGSGGQCALAPVAGGGAASCSVSYTPNSTESNPSRTDAITASYGGDGGHSLSDGATQLTVIAPTPLPRGSFVIGDENAAVGTTVTFWGAQWWSLNGLSGGPAPASFKGFAAQTPNNPPQCGDRWTSSPGASSSPPTSVPQYMEAIVASQVSKQGSTISGNTEHVVVVKTNPGYGPDPDQPGTGTVIAQAC